MVGEVSRMAGEGGGEGLRRGGWGVAKRGEGRGDERGMAMRDEGEGSRDGGGGGGGEGEGEGGGGEMDCVVMTHFLGDFFNSPIKWFNWRISASFSSTPNPPDFRHTYNPLQFFHARTRLPFCTSLLLQSPVFFPHYLSHPFSFLTTRILLLQSLRLLVVLA